MKVVVVGCTHAGTAAIVNLKEIHPNSDVTVYEKNTIIELTKLVKENRLSSIPVVDENNKLVGLITRSSLITALSQQFLEEDI